MKQMGRGIVKYIIMNDYVQFQLALQNCYHDKARKIFIEMCAKLEYFYEQKEVSRHYYKKMSKELREYEIMYQGLDIRKRQKNWNKKAYIVNKTHFG